MNETQLGLAQFFVGVSFVFTIVATGISIAKLDFPRTLLGFYLRVWNLAKTIWMAATISAGLLLSGQQASIVAIAPAGDGGETGIMAGMKLFGVNCAFIMLTAVAVPMLVDVLLRPLWAKERSEVAAMPARREE